MTTRFGNSSFLGNLIFTQGTAASPSLHLSGDNNTGIYSPGADALAFTTGGVQKLLTQTTASGAEVVLTGSTALQLHSGSVSQRPSSPANGMIRYNSEDNFFEGYENGSWVRFATTQSAFADNLFRIYDNDDNTKFLAFEVSPLTTATTRTVTMVDRNITLDTITMGSTDTNATAGSILFSTGSKIQSNGANLFWDQTNNRLGIGTNTPSTALAVAGPISATGTSPGEIRWYENPTNGSNYVSLQAPVDITNNVNWTLPASDGSPWQVLTTNGSGVLSWQNSGYYSSSNGETFETIVTITTTNNVTQTAYSYTPGANRASIMETYAVAKNITNDQSAAYIRRARFRFNNTGAATIVNLATEYTSEDVSAWVQTLDANGNSARVRVTGQTGVTIEWFIKVKITTVST